MYVKPTTSSRGRRRGSIFACTSSCTPVLPASIMNRNDSREILKTRYCTSSVATGTNSSNQWHDAVLVHRFGLAAPNSGGKDVADSGDFACPPDLQRRLRYRRLFGRQASHTNSGLPPRSRLHGSATARLCRRGAKERKGWLPGGIVPAEIAGNS